MPFQEAGLSWGKSGWFLGKEEEVLILQPEKKFTECTARRFSVGGGCSRSIFNNQVREVGRRRLGVLQNRPTCRVETQPRDGVRWRLPWPA